MAGCGRGRVIAHPASAGFCSPQVKLTTPDRNVIELRGRDQGEIPGLTRYVP
jgi:hypothetical protein